MCAVEWKCLNEIANVTIGEFVHKDKQNPNAEYPVYNGGISNTGYYEDFNNTGNKIIISARGANAGYINRVFVNYWAGNSCYSISVTSNDVDWNFLFYFLKTNQQKLIGEQQKGGIPAISKKQICTFEIPIPSLAKQQEIVSHLDTFTALISNLESELDMRRKQYEHYRNQLLDFEGVEGVEWKTLGEVCDFIRGPFGGALKKEMFVKEGYAIYEQQHAIYGDWIFRYFINDDKFHQMKRFEVKAGEILMSCSGTMGKTSIVPENPIKGIINQALLKLSVKEIATNKFVKAFMDSSWFQKGLSQNAPGGAIQNVASVSILKTLEIPVPSLKTQQEIVEKLDAFENLIQSLEQEIKLRKQQYEYYREKLLTFE